MDAGANLCELFLLPLEEAEIPYFVTGSVASSAYGTPRFTQDLDLVIALQRSSIPRFLAAFPGQKFYVAPKSALLEELSRDDGGHTNLIHHETGGRADMYMAGNDELHAWAFDHRRRVELMPEFSIWLAPPEYVILRKLEYLVEGGGERHVDDIRHMLEVMGRELDAHFLTGQIERRGLVSHWRRAQP